MEHLITYYVCFTNKYYKLNQNKKLCQIMKFIPGKISINIKNHVSNRKKLRKHIFKQLILLFFSFSFFHFWFSILFHQCIGLE
jgi:hypothetical protein